MTFQESNLRLFHGGVWYLSKTRRLHRAHEIVFLGNTLCGRDKFATSMASDLEVLSMCFDFVVHFQFFTLNFLNVIRSLESETYNSAIAYLLCDN